VPPGPAIPIDLGRRRIGLLGGSFNPAHAGHRHISLLALHRLGLDEVWWLVSPQNPLKPRTDMAPLAERLAEARRVANHPRIRVSDIERRLGTRYTIDTIERLRARFPAAALVWIMGADNLIEFARWRRWTDIFRAAPIAIFDRPTYSYKALASKAAQRLARFRVARERAHLLAGMTPPAWVFLRGRLHPESGTELRRRRRMRV